MVENRMYAEYIVKKISDEFKKKEEQKTKDDVNGSITEKEEFVKWLDKLSKKDIPIVGGKGANLGEMYNNGFPVPPAFVVSAQAFSYFLEYNNLKEKIHETLKTINIDNTAELEAKAKEIREFILGVEMPPKLKSEIVEAYRHIDTDHYIEDSKGASSDALGILRAGKEPCFVAVRSSATTEDLSTASFAGQQETFLNIKGDTELIEAVKRCFASLFTARAIYYREKQGFEHEKSLIAVVVQRMINSDKSGVIFTVNPSTNEQEIIVEAVWGLGEGIVSGAIKPDQYILNKPNLELKSKKISKKEMFFTRTAAGKTITQLLHESKQKAQVLTKSELKQLGNYSMKLEEHYNHPQDIEFAIESGSIYIVQTRPVTTLVKKVQKREIKGEVILQGLAASPGISSGVVRIIRTMHDLSKVQKGDVLVTKMTNPDMVVTMQRAAAIVTDEGGTTAHASIVSREMGIPCVVGTKSATTTLEEGKPVTVDGFNGRVYKGDVAETQKAEVKPVVETRTEIKVITDLPDFAERAAETHAAGVGLLRLEGIIASAEKHPMQYLRENKTEDYKNLLLQGIKRIVQHFPNKPAWIRTSDIRTDEFQHLKGSPEVETNPMLGMHGIRASLKHPQLLKAELQAVKEATEQGFLIGVMLPQVISIDDVKEVKKLFSEINMPDKVELGVMIETPASVQVIDKLCEEGIDFISFGTNDLTQFTLAIDRGNEELQELYNEMHPAILSQLSHVIQVCKKHGVKTSICGQAGSNPKMAKFLVKEGINSISVNADAAHDVSSIVAQVEKEIEAEKETEIEQEEKIETTENIEEIEETAETEPTEMVEVAEESAGEHVGEFPEEQKAESVPITETQAETQEEAEDTMPEGVKDVDEVKFNFPETDLYIPPIIQQETEHGAELLEQQIGHIEDTEQIEEETPEETAVEQEPLVESEEPIPLVEEEPQAEEEGLDIF